MLDLAGSTADRAALRELAAGADVLIESRAPAHWPRSASAPPTWRRSTRRWCTRRSRRSASTAQGARGRPPTSPCGRRPARWSSTGDDDRAPVRPACRRRSCTPSAETAAGAIVAALVRAGALGPRPARRRVGTAGRGAGHAVDDPGRAERRHRVQRVAPAASRSGRSTLQLLWPCPDGHVSITFLFGTAIGPATARLMDWIHEEGGYCDEATRDKDWVAYGELLFSGERAGREFERVKDVVDAFCADRTKAELLQGGDGAPPAHRPGPDDRRRRRTRPSSPTVTTGSTATAFATRGRSPSSARTPLSPPPAPPRRLGEHTAAVLAEPPPAPSVTPRPQPATVTARPLDGVKMLDLMWVMAGPAGTRVLTDLGATVVRVESATRVETARTLQPFKNDVVTTWRASSLFANMNAGKHGHHARPRQPGEPRRGLRPRALGRRA